MSEKAKTVKYGVGKLEMSSPVVQLKAKRHCIISEVEHFASSVRG